MGFMDGIFKDDDKKNSKKNKNNNNNSLGGILQQHLPGGRPKKFGGEGQSLGGTLPGKVISVIFPETGPLGIRVEKGSASKAAIVAEVVPGSAAERAGLQRGDILCFANSDGRKEIMYNEFLALAKSSERPLYLDLRRVPKTKSDNDNKNNNNAGRSAEAFARKQAVIAAAERREKKSKAINKPTKKMTATTKARLENLEKIKNNNNSQDGDDSCAPKTAAAAEAAEAAKSQEAITAAALGYNPYETNKVTAGQARNATVTVQHGDMSGGTNNNNNNGTKQQNPPTQASTSNIPVVSPPVDPTVPAEDSDTAIEPSPSFERAYETVVTHNENTAVVHGFSIMRKLITNATTKGQQVADDPDKAAKFRRVRLTNAKIKAAIVDVEGALDLMLAVGFQLTVEDDAPDDSFLVFLPGDPGPDWLATALKRMEAYETASSV